MFSSFFEVYMSIVDMRTTNSLDAYETPQWLVEEVRKFYGGIIDLDPCTSPNNPVDALSYYTEGDDGLSKWWAGNVYVNSPYGRALGEWSETCYRTVDLGRCTQVVQLVPARMGAKWFRQSSRRCDALGVFNRRLRFTINGEPVCDKRGRPTTAQFDSALLYYGGDTQRFQAHFAPHLTYWRIG